MAWVHDKGHDKGRVGNSESRFSGLTIAPAFRHNPLSVLCLSATPLTSAAVLAGLDNDERLRKTCEHNNKPSR